MAWLCLTMVLGLCTQHLNGLVLLSSYTVAKDDAKAPVISKIENGNSLQETSTISLTSIVIECSIDHWWLQNHIRLDTKNYSWGRCLLQTTFKHVSSAERQWPWLFARACSTKVPRPLGPGSKQTPRGGSSHEPSRDKTATTPYLGKKPKKHEEISVLTCFHLSFCLYQKAIKGLPLEPIYFDKNLFKRNQEALEQTEDNTHQTKQPSKQANTRRTQAIKQLTN